MVTGNGFEAVYSCETLDKRLQSQNQCESLRLTSALWLNK